MTLQSIGPPLSSAQVYSIAQLPPTPNISRYDSLDTSSPASELAKHSVDDREDASHRQIFLDAMAVREEVFVREQSVPAENEVDGDEGRSWHWVIYANNGIEEGEIGNGGDGRERRPGNGGLVPVGTVRLVPPPHDQPAQPSSTSTSVSPSISVSSTSSSLPASSAATGNPDTPSMLIVPREKMCEGEPYIKLTRLAVLHSYRRRGLAARLTQSCLNWAAAHAHEIDQSARSKSGQESKQIDERKKFRQWQGLVRIHAQVGAVRWYEGQGFELEKDEKGKVRDGWDEEGIWHLGMWKKVKLRKSEEE